MFRFLYVLGFSSFQRNSSKFVGSYRRHRNLYPLKCLERDHIQQKCPQYIGGEASWKRKQAHVHDRIHIGFLEKDQQSTFHLQSNVFWVVFVDMRQCRALLSEKRGVTQNLCARQPHGNARFRAKILS